MGEQRQFDFEARRTRAHQIFTAFVQFHLDNPRIWALFQQYTKDAIGRGRENYSAYAIFERIRWHVEIETSGELKLNNNFRPYYARMFHAKHPEHDGFFHTRRRTSEDKDAYEDDIQVFDFGPAGGEAALIAKLKELA